MAAHARTVPTGESLTLSVGGGRLLPHRAGPQRRRIVATVRGEQDEGR